MSDAFHEDREILALVAAAVDQLPDDHREIVNGFFWEGLSHPQNIERLGCRPATYYRRFAEARALLADALRDLYPMGCLPADD